MSEVFVIRLHAVDGYYKFVVLDFRIIFRLSRLFWTWFSNSHVLYSKPRQNLSVSPRSASCITDHDNFNPMRLQARIFISNT